MQVYICVSVCVCVWAHAFTVCMFVLAWFKVPAHSYSSPSPQHHLAVRLVTTTPTTLLNSWMLDHCFGNITGMRRVWETLWAGGWCDEGWEWRRGEEGGRIRARWSTIFPTELILYFVHVHTHLFSHLFVHFLFHSYVFFWRKLELYSPRGN